MAIYSIPLTNDSPSFTQKIELDGKEYTLQMRWNGRIELWIFDLYDFQGDAVALGEPFYTSTRLMRNLVDEKNPSGVLLALNLKIEEIDATRFSIGVDVKLYYEDFL